MEIDKIKVQKLINETIGSEYEINEISDTSKYVFISWKHKDYEIDDERGYRIGVGPVAFNKITKEYKLLGSGDMLDEEYHKYLFENLEEKEQEFEVPKKEEIKHNILRRKYVNDEDIFFLIENFKADFGDLDCFLSFMEDVDPSSQAVVNLDNKKAIDYFKEFWNDIDFNYSLISESKIILNKTPVPNNV